MTPEEIGAMPSQGDASATKAAAEIRRLRALIAKAPSTRIIEEAFDVCQQSRQTASQLAHRAQEVETALDLAVSAIDQLLRQLKEV